MSGSFHSDRWYRVAPLVPVLRAQAQVHRHRYRNQIAYVLQDAASTRMIRFSESGARLFNLMDGRRTVEQIWQLLVADASAPPPRQDEVIDMLSAAHSADLVQVDLPPEIATLAQRRLREQKQKVKRQYLNVMSIRLPLWDPERFLSATVAAVRPLFGRAGLLVWFMVVLLAGVLAIAHWDELTHNVHDRLLSVANLALVALVYPVVKALHELGHGYAMKALGGRVHEMGIMFIYLMPVPYVEASAANAFGSKWQRAAVSAAGILVETSLAALAMLVWLAVEPGIVRTLAFNVMLVCGVSTVLFNGNPLMRYDGYFVLADAVEMPNLAQRSASQWTHLIRKRIFRVEGDAPVAHDFRERAWLWLYHPLALGYRLFISVSIAVWLAEEYFFIGVLLALLMCWSTFVKPLWKGVVFLVTDPRLGGRRPRVLASTCAAIAAIAALVVFVPVPLHRSFEGVVWLPEDAQIRAGEDAFVEQVLRGPSTIVTPGEPVVLTRSRELEANIEKSAWRVRELEVEYGMKQLVDRVGAAVALESLKAETVELQRLQAKAERLVLRAEALGTLSMARVEDLPGRFVRKGQLLGYVLNDRPRVARVVVEQEDIDLVRSHLQNARLLVTGSPGDRRPTRVLREVPAGQNEIPMPALSVQGGGRIVADPRDPDGTTALNRVFQFDFELPPDMRDVPMGSRVYVGVAFKPEPIWDQVARKVRQVFLTRLSV